MTKNARIGLIALCSTLLLAGGTLATGDEQSKSKEREAKVGEQAPDFTLLDHDGKKHTLSNYKDKIVVLEWINQQCPWSVKVAPMCRDLAKKWDDKDVVWIGVESTHWRKAEENQKYAKDKELGYPILMDNDGKVGRMYGAKTTPHMYIIEKGKLVYAGGIHNNQHGTKSDSDVRIYVDEALAALTAGKEVPVAETTPWGCSVKYNKSK
jgi:peroxiredoxin